MKVPAETRKLTQKFSQIESTVHELEENIEQVDEEELEILYAKQQSEKRRKQREIKALVLNLTFESFVRKFCDQNHRRRSAKTPCKEARSNRLSK